MPQLETFVFIVPGQLVKNGDERLVVLNDVDGARLAVSLSLLQGNNTIALCASSNYDYNNLGKLLNVETIQEACRLRVDEISFMTGMQWKANWKMKSEPCRAMRKPPVP